MRLRLLPFLVLVWLSVQVSLLMLPQIARAQGTINMSPGQLTYNVGDEMIVHWDPNGPCIQAIGSAGQLSATGPYGSIPIAQLSHSQLMYGYWDIGPAEQPGNWIITLTVSSSNVDLTATCQSSGSTSFQVIGSTCVQTSVTITTTASTTSLMLLHVSTTATTTATTTVTITSDLTSGQILLTVAATAAVAGVASRIYMSQKHPMIRITQRRIGRRPGPAFGVDVKSGVDREVPPS